MTLEKPTLAEQATKVAGTNDNASRYAQIVQDVQQIQQKDSGNTGRTQTDLHDFAQQLHERGILPGLEITGANANDQMSVRNDRTGQTVVLDQQTYGSAGNEHPNTQPLAQSNGTETAATTIATPDVSGDPAANPGQATVETYMGMPVRLTANSKTEQYTYAYDNTSANQQSTHPQLTYATTIDSKGANNAEYKLNAPDANGLQTGVRADGTTIKDFTLNADGSFKYQIDTPSSKDSVDRSGDSVIHNTDNSEVTTGTDGKVTDVKYANGSQRQFQYDQESGDISQITETVNGKTKVLVPDSDQADHPGAYSLKGQQFDSKTSILNPEVDADGNYHYQATTADKNRYRINTDSNGTTPAPETPDFKPEQNNQPQPDSQPQTKFGSGSENLTYSYDGSTGKPISVTSQNGDVTETLAKSGAAWTANGTGPDGKSYTRNINGEPQFDTAGGGGYQYSYTDAGGNSGSAVQNPDGSRVENITDQNKNQTSITYDKTGTTPASISRANAKNGTTVALVSDANGNYNLITGPTPDATPGAPPPSAESYKITPVKNGQLNKDGSFSYQTDQQAAQNPPTQTVETANGNELEGPVPQAGQQFQPGKVNYPDGTSRSFTYDTNGSITDVSFADGQGNTQTWKQDPTYHTWVNDQGEPVSVSGLTVDGKTGAFSYNFTDTNDPQNPKTVRQTVPPGLSQQDAGVELMPTQIGQDGRQAAFYPGTDNSGVYNVKPGDNLWSIASDLSQTIYGGDSQTAQVLKQLIEQNPTTIGNDPNLIYAGQQYTFNLDENGQGDSSS